MNNKPMFRETEWRLIKLGITVVLTVASMIYTASLDYPFFVAMVAGVIVFFIFAFALGIASKETQIAITFEQHEEKYKAAIESVKIALQEHRELKKTVRELIEEILKLFDTAVRLLDKKNAGSLTTMEDIVFIAGKFCASTVSYCVANQVKTSLTDNFSDQLLPDIKKQLDEAVQAMASSRMTESNATLSALADYLKGGGILH